MAENRSRRIPPTVLNDDVIAYAALQGIADYKPANENFATKTIEAAKQEMEAARTEEAQAEAAFMAARDRAASAEWAFHDKILGAKDQVKAQYGKNSDQIQAMGLKKDSERKRRTAKPKTDGDKTKTTQNT